MIRIVGIDMTLNDYAASCHKNAVGKGFYDDPLPFPALVMLAVTELSEAVEADRKDLHSASDIKELEHVIYYSGTSTNKYCYWFEDCIKNTVEDELADALIRIFDICWYLDIDIEAHVKAKMRYNETRPKKHGKAY